MIKYKKVSLELNGELYTYIIGNITIKRDEWVTYIPNIDGVRTAQLGKIVKYCTTETSNSSGNIPTATIMHRVKQKDLLWELKNNFGTAICFKQKTYYNEAPIQVVIVARDTTVAFSYDNIQDTVQAQAILQQAFTDSFLEKAEKELG